MSSADLISPSYAEQNRLLHASNAGYGRRGARHAPTVCRIVEAHSAQTVLDYGCGKARFAEVMRGLMPSVAVQSYDPCIPKFANAPTEAGVVLCSDVLEHVEPEKLDAVLLHIRSLTRLAAFIVVATKPDQTKTLPDGRNPHLSVHNAEWWFAKLLSLFPVVVRHEETRRDVSFLVLQNSKGS